MRFSPALNSFWVFYIPSQLPPTAQICNTFLRIGAVPNKLYTVHLGTPATYQSLSRLFRGPL